MAKFYPARSGRGRLGGSVQPVGGGASAASHPAAARPMDWAKQVQDEKDADDAGSRSTIEGQKAMDDLFKVRERFISEQQKSLDRRYVPQFDQMNDFMKSREKAWKDLIADHKGDPKTHAKLINGQVQETMQLLGYRRDLQNQYADAVDALPGMFDAEIARADDYRGRFGAEQAEVDLDELAREEEEGMVDTLGKDSGASQYEKLYKGITGWDEETTTLPDRDLASPGGEIGKFVGAAAQAKMSEIRSTLRAGKAPGSLVTKPWGDEYREFVDGRRYGGEDFYYRMKDWELNDSETDINHTNVNYVTEQLNKLHEKIVGPIADLGTAGYTPEANSPVPQSDILDWLASLIGSE